MNAQLDEFWLGRGLIAKRCKILMEYRTSESMQKKNAF